MISSIFPQRVIIKVMNTLKITICSLCLLAMNALPSTAHADLFGIWVKPKVDFVSGTGEIFKRFEGQPAGGLEVGLELFGLSFWGDAEFMSESQYWASGNLGIDFSFGETVKFTIGAYGGLIFFGFPESDNGGSTAVDNTQEDKITTLLNGIPGSPISYNDFESTYNDYFGDEDKLADTAFGINGRLRLSLEYQLISALSIGVQGSSGYHYIITGEEAASSTKSLAIDGFIASYPIPDAAQAELKKELKEILGAEEVDVNDLKGVNYSVGAFLNLSF
jgi:hypothetical protein